MSSPTYHYTFPDSRPVANGLHTPSNFVNHHNNSHQAVVHTQHDLALNKYRIPRDNQHHQTYQHTQQQASTNNSLHHQRHFDNSQIHHHCHVDQSANTTNQYFSSTSFNYHASQPNTIQINIFVHQVLRFTSIDAIIPFANDIIHTSSTSNSSNNPFQFFLRAILEVLDIWASTLFESFSKPPQLLLALAAPSSPTLKTAAFAFIETHQAKSIFDHLKFNLLLNNLTYKDYLLDLNERSDLYIECCLLAGNISCVSIQCFFHLISNHGQK